MTFLFAPLEVFGGIRSLVGRSVGRSLTHIPSFLPIRSMRLEIYKNVLAF